MSEGFRLFVYGQLRRGGIGWQRLGLQERVKWLGEARVHGRLYDLGDYPGLILGGDGIVHGEVLGFGDPALWAVLDDYENCDPQRPDGSEYRREPVDLVDGALALAYVFNRSVDNRCVVADGIWIGARSRSPGQR